MDNLLEKLRKKLNEYDEFTSTAEEEHKILCKNTFRSKLINFILSTIAFFAACLPLVAMIFTINSAFFLFYLSYAFSALGGLLYTINLSEIEKSKLKKISTANTSNEILLEKYQKELLIYKYKTLSKVIDDILKWQEKCEWIVNASKYWDELNLPIDSYSYAELCSKREELEQKYKEIEEQISVAVTKCFLIDKFSSSITESDRKEEGFEKKLCCGIVGAFLGGMPVLVDYFVGLFTVNLFSVFAIGCCTTLASTYLYSVYQKENSFNKMPVFRNINNSLGIDKRLNYEQVKKENLLTYEKELKHLVLKLVELGNKLFAIEFAISKKEEESPQKQSRLQFGYIFNPAKPLDMGSSHTNSNGLRKTLEKKEGE